MRGTKHLSPSPRGPGRRAHHHIVQGEGDLGERAIDAPRVAVVNSRSLVGVGYDDAVQPATLSVALGPWFDALPPVDV